MAKKVDAAPLWAALLSVEGLAEAAARCWPGGDAISKLARWFGGRRASRDMARLIELERSLGSLEVERARAAGARMIAQWSRRAMDANVDGEAAAKGPGASEIRAMVDLIKATQPRPAVASAAKRASKAVARTPVSMADAPAMPADQSDEIAREMAERYRAHREGRS